jgi:ABC-type branched-subunit amino acid transport system permease subunit
VLIGLPAIRIQGLYLAVTTLAFGYAMQNYVLNPSFALGDLLLPTARSGRSSGRRCTAGSTSRTTPTSTTPASSRWRWTMAAALAFRSNRSGRVVIAMRDNQRAARRTR